MRTYLELDDPARFRKPSRVPPDTRVERLSPCPVAAYRRLYRDVGAQWYWHDRLEWSDEQLAEYLARDDVTVWEMTTGGVSAGYFELQLQENDSVEIVYFGLTGEFIGQGLGGWLLGRAVEEAWAMGARRVWLHTCTLDRRPRGARRACRHDARRAAHDVVTVVPRARCRRTVCAVRVVARQSHRACGPSRGRARRSPRR